MAVQILSEEGQPVSATVMQQLLVQQAQAAAAAQSECTISTRPEASRHTTDLFTPDAADGDVPPPAYGEIYGEIRNEKNGLGTSASVTDDGRVNIRINQLNRRLSQLFTPALHQQVQDFQDSHPTPSPYIPPYLGGDEGAPPPPRLNIVIQVVGSRGDVQPFVALGKVLKDNYGHRVRLASHPMFKEFVQENGLEFFSIGADPSRLMAFMVKNPSLMPGFRSLLSGDVSERRKDVAEYIQGCWRSCYEAGDGLYLRASDGKISKKSENDPGFEPTARPFTADCIIANPPSFAHIHCAEKLGIPLHIMFTMPYSPTQAFPHPLANIQSSNADPQLTNYLSYAMIEILSWQGLGDIINRFRARCLGLDPVSLIWVPGMLQRLKIPHTYCWSPALIPKPEDWGPQISISGFYFLNLASAYSPAPDFQAFLDAGPCPIYIGFGSIVLDDPNAMTELIFEVVRRTGQRVLLSKGWGGIDVEDLQVPDGVFILGNVPHDWLFKHVSCVVHHGGAGTTAAGIAAGRPTVVVPFFGDQPFWGAMIARAGAGPDPIPYKQLTADKLADAIKFCLKPESLERAGELASKIAAERGCDRGAQSFHQYLEADRLRCTLAPSRAATWRIKRTHLKLSTFAVCTLVNAKLLDYHELELFRPQEYCTDEGPWDPISGGASACFRAFTSMAMGVAEFPSETLRPLYTPTGSSRHQTQDSTPITAKENNISHVDGRTTPPTSPQQSETNFNVREPLTRVRSPPKPSRPFTPVSNSGSGSMFSASDNDLSHKEEDTRKGRVPSQNISGAGKRDMLRQTGVHTSKGLGRIVKAAVKAPMEVSTSLNQGFHNLPKLWGDDTVRPQEQVSGFKSGAVAAGKEFSFGLYDGVTGLVTQPWKGAQKGGAGGFVKGFGKGIGGFATKPLAALSGVLSHTMKGVHKEMQKLFGSNVQSYIIGSRVAQGYEEWLQSSDEEKQNVIVQWKLIQDCLKNTKVSEGVIQEVLEAHRKKSVGNTEAPQNCGQTETSNHSANNNTPSQNPESPILVADDSHFPSELPEMGETSEAVRLPHQETSSRNVDEDIDIERAIQESLSQLQRQRQEAADSEAEQEHLRRTIIASEFETQQQTSEALQYEKQLKQVLAQSLRQQTQRRDNSEWGPDADNHDEDDHEFERFNGASDYMSGKVASLTVESPGIQERSSYDPEHLAGTTQREFEAGRQREQKRTQERTEEEIVMEYVKKQSLLELHHSNKGKGRATATEDKHEKDYRKALKLSMEKDANARGYRSGEASGI